MIYAGRKRVGPWWNYKNVNSPFYRLIYVESGEGRIWLDGKAWDLAPGKMFLVPKFMTHSYECGDFMDHSYICFFDNAADCIGIPRPDRLNFLADADELDMSLFRRFLRLNPAAELAATDPRHYDNAPALYSRINSNTQLTSRALQSQGALMQLFARFITKESLTFGGGPSSMRNLHDLIAYVGSNLTGSVNVAEMAKTAHLSADHFTKVFKRVMGVTPNLYIQIKRMQQAQTLLLTTDAPIAEIAESVGIPNQSNFARIFLKHTGLTPSNYRRSAPVL